MQGAPVSSAVCGYVDSSEDDECCVICLDCTREMMFLPCGHMVCPMARVLQVALHSLSSAMMGVMCDSAL